MSPLGSHSLGHRGEAPFNRRLGAEAEKRSCQERIADRGANVAGTGRPVPELQFSARNGFDGADQIEKRNGEARADIGCGRCRAGFGHGRAQSADRVGDIHEVPRLFAIAENLETPAEVDAIHQDRNHAGIGRRGVLARAVNIEWPKTKGRQASRFARSARAAFAIELVYTVGRDGMQRAVLLQRQGRAVAVNGGRGRVDDGDKTSADRGVENGLGSAQVDATGSRGILIDAGNRGDGCQVKAAGGSGHDAINQGCVGDVADNNLGFRGYVLAPSRGQVVENSDAVSVRDKRFDQVRANESTAAGYKVCRHKSPNISVARKSSGHWDSDRPALANCSIPINLSQRRIG